MRMKEDPFVILSRNYYVKPPRIAGNYENPFDSMKRAPLHGKELCKEHGFIHVNTGPTCWIYVDRGVEPHRDGGGKCLLYLHRGRGTLFVLSRGRIHNIRVSPGFVVAFNDRQEHFWLSEKPCTMLVCNYRERNK